MPVPSASAPLLLCAIILLCPIFLSPRKTISSRSSMSFLATAAASDVPTQTDGVMATEYPNKNFVGELVTDMGFYQSMEVTPESPLLTRKSKYQEISVFESRHYGKILVLDGVVQLTEKDADSYNEMMAHVPLMAHVNPRNVLVIGGGDGYVLSEVLKHASVEHVDHVDLDGDVIETCREHFSWGKAWDDPRVELHITDGSAFTKNAPDSFYDVVIQDSSDPWSWDDDGELVELPSSILYSRAHFENILRILRTDGLFNFQAETFNIPSDVADIAEWRKQALEVGFRSVKYGSLTISSYPTGQIGFLLCSRKPAGDSPGMDDVTKRFDEMKRNGMTTSYYHPRLQRSTFDLPLWVETSIYGESRLDVLESSKSNDEL